MPIDPVCGIEMDESLALIHEHDGEKYYFCCNGCKRIFIKKTKKIQEITLEWKLFHTFYKILNQSLIQYYSPKHEFPL